MYSLELTAINKILINKGFINIVINDILKESKLDVKRKALFTRIVYGVVENKILLDYQISFYLEKDSLPKEVKNLLRMATYMVLYMNLSNHHVVLEIVEMVKKISPNYTSLFNGILRNITRNQEQEVYFDDYNRLLSVKYSYPISLISLLKKQYPDMIEDILKHDSETYNVYRINTLKTTIEFIKEDLKDYEFELIGTALITKANLTNLNIFKKGFIVYQDLASQRVSEVLNPTANSKILDMCSAPGSKAFHMAALTNNLAEITCCDIYEHKIKLIEKSSKRLGLDIIKTKVCDASQYDSKLGEFDCVLCDVPCSGLGIIRRKPEIKYKNFEEFDDLCKIQLNIIENAKKYLKKGGKLLYSTCTLRKKENENIVEQFLENNKDFSLKFSHTFMPHKDNTDGFFCSLMIKN